MNKMPSMKVNKCKPGKTEGKDNFDSFKMRQTPRRARKYVFFEVASGKIVFEYGGVKIPS